MLCTAQPGRTVPPPPPPLFATTCVLSGIITCEKRAFFEQLKYTIILPRQARDKHRERGDNHLAAYVGEHIRPAVALICRHRIRFEHPALALQECEKRRKVEVDGVGLRVVDVRVVAPRAGAQNGSLF